MRACIENRMNQGVKNSLIERREEVEQKRRMGEWMQWEEGNKEER